MKKFILILFLSLSLLSLNISYADQRKSVVEKVITVAIPAGLSIWGFSRKTSYGTTTGILFSLSALIRLVRD